ncbi:thiol reductant ABC exporter subunit CydD [Prauserella muralis]|uniref:Glutathione/cysteine ABC transporter permease/ATPase n=1 Tax=Prauserella muralis TaxID=588067 RepID=A0A2V4ANQ3_9PSEU|nr:thiol reductant ABC exporter subunit CydD [Prauserella muralis]PXY22333.1 glutathione/cysteine ABC transporter permease/ATPase [Prauserella muralis]TWE27985.1 ATP-binding cassette subfamily C protein CydCD [Prauserella muralis]
MRPLDPRLLRHARSARPFVLGCAAVGVLTAALVIAQAGLLAGIVTDAFLGGADLAALAAPVALLAAVVAGRAALAWAAESAAHRASASVIGELRAKLMAHVLRPGPARTGGRSPAELATIATRGLDGLDGYFARYLPQLLVAAVVPATVTAWILLQDWVAAVVVAVTVPLIPIFMILIGLYTQRDTRRQWRTLALLGNHFLDLVAGLGVLSAFGRAGTQAATIRRVTERYRAQTMRTLRVAFLSALVLELLATLSVAMVAVSIGLRLVSGTLDLHTALVVLILAPEVYLPLRAVGARFHDSAEGLAAAEEAFEVLADEGAPEGNLPAPDPARTGLRLAGVRVEGRGGPILDGFSLTVAGGEVVGITGPSGAGKSTLLDVVLGRRRPGAGTVEAGGISLPEVDPESWLGRIAWVPQRPRLVSGTVEDNIRLGSPDASRATVLAAAEAAALDVPLDTAVGELGAALSTGQQRRVALARALVLDRPLLLLDEPTEGVDAETEDAILAALPGALAGRTALVVTHRPAVLRACDRVVTLRPPSPQDAAPAPARPDAVPGARTRAPGSPREEEPGDRPAPAGQARGRWGWLPAAIRPYRLRLALAAAAGAGALGSGVALTATSAWLIATAALHPPVLTLTVAIVAVRTFGISKGVLRYVERLVSHDAALRALADLRVRVWTSLVRLGPAATARLRRGELLDRLVSDVDSQQDVLVRGVIPVAASALVGAGAATGLGLLLPSAGLTLAAGLLAAGLAAPALSVLAARAAQRRTGLLRAEVAAGTVELLDAAPDLVAFGAVGARHARVRRDGDRLTAALRRSALARGLGMGLSTLAIGGTMVACTVLGITALRAGQLSGPGLAVLALTPLACAELVAMLPENAQRLLGAGHAARRLASLGDTPAPATEPARPRPVPAATPLAAERLAVRWPGAGADAVRDVGLAVSPGSRIVLTGPSGSGKSTVLAALMRCLDPARGRVTVGGADARELAGTQVRAGIGWCGPASHLFDSTLRENLRLAAPHSTDAELVAALRAAQLGGWFAALPHGLDTALGAHGTPVSGGERQRLGVARTILADRPVLLLDEPTAHLDAATADVLAADLTELTTGRAAVIVSHRPDEFPALPAVPLGGARQVPLARSA